MPLPRPRGDATCTASVEDYLKAIYELCRATNAASTSAIARRLHVTPPSVTGMVRHLTEQGFLNYQPYHGVRLKPKGKRSALRVLWRHRVIKMYVMRVLHCSWTVAEAEAERLEHAVSDELVNRMAAAGRNSAVLLHGISNLASTGTARRDKPGSTR
jgi:DtxR family Mn-dependent transcriptional regulator